MVDLQEEPSPTLSTCKLGRSKLSRGEIKECAPQTVTGFDQRKQIVVLTRTENIVVGNSAGSNDSRDLTAYEFRALLSRLHLVADGDFVPFTKKPGNVPVRGMIGDPAHGTWLFAVFVPGSEGNLQLPRCRHRIFKEKFVEIPEAEQQKSIRHILLHGVVLPEHWSQ
jgi:hypothetical protein